MADKVAAFGWGCQRWGDGGLRVARRHRLRIVPFCLRRRHLTGIVGAHGPQWRKRRRLLLWQGWQSSEAKAGTKRWKWLSGRCHRSAAALNNSDRAKRTRAPEILGITLLAVCLSAGGSRAAGGNPTTVTLEPIGTIAVPAGTRIESTPKTGLDFLRYDVVDVENGKSLVGIYLGNAPSFPLRRIPDIRNVSPCAGLSIERPYDISLNGVRHKGIEWAHLVKIENSQEIGISFPEYVHFFLRGDDADALSVALATEIVRSLKLNQAYQCANTR